MPANINPFKEYGILDHGVTVDTDTRGQDASRYASTAYDAALADNAVMRLAPSGLSPGPFIIEYKFGRRKLGLESPDGPFGIVEVEHGIDADKVHAGLVVGIEGADIPPIGHGFLVFVLEPEGMHIKPGDDAGDDVFAEVVRAVFSGGIFKKQLEQSRCGEHINAHRGE